MRIALPVSVSTEEELILRDLPTGIAQEVELESKLDDTDLAKYDSSKNEEQK